MAHEKVYGVCENKCFVEVETKENTDAVETRVADLEPRVDTLETQMDSCVKVGEDINGDLKATGRMEAAGFLGKLYLKCKLSTVADSAFNLAYTNAPSNTLASNSGFSNNYDDSKEYTMNASLISDYTIQSIAYPYKIGTGIYVNSADDIEDVDKLLTTNKSILATVKCNSSNGAALQVYVNNNLVHGGLASNHSHTFTVKSGDVIKLRNYSQYGSVTNFSLTISYPTLYVVEQ